VGYTPPYQAPPPPTPLTGWQARLGRWRALRLRANRSSMAWWSMKALQGIFLGGILFALGVLIVVAYAALDGVGALAALGVLLLIAGLLTIARYALAPLTCRWIVTVPENRYWAVEDGTGFTIDYLAPGRVTVPWRMNARIVDYVDFNRIATNDVIRDVLAGNGPAVNVEISVIMNFDPVAADPNLFAQLRTMTTLEQFQRMITRDTRDAVRKHLERLTLDQRLLALRQSQLLEDAVAATLERQHAALGLTLASSRPVMVFVSGALPAAEPDIAPRQDGASASEPTPPPRKPDDTPRDPLTVRRERRDRRRHD
jgi:hypothetical protein